MLRRRGAPYAIAIGGVIGITAAIGLITSLASVQGLSALYVLLALWLGASCCAASRYIVNEPGVGCPLEA